MKFGNLLLIFFSMGLAGCSTIAVPKHFIELQKQCQKIPNAKISIVNENAKEITFRLCGEIGPKTPELLINTLDGVAPGKKIRMEIISPGGYAFVVTEITDMLNSHQITVIFPGLCASSCVNILAKLNSIEIRKTAIFVEHFAGADYYLYISQALKNHENKNLDLSEFEFSTKLYGPDTPHGKNEEITYAAQRASFLNVTCVGFAYEDKLYIHFDDKQLIVKEYDNWVLSKPYLVERITAKKIKGLKNYRAQDNMAVFGQIAGTYARNILSTKPIVKNKDSYRLCTKEDMIAKNNRLK